MNLKLSSECSESQRSNGATIQGVGETNNLGFSLPLGSLPMAGATSVAQDYDLCTCATAQHGSTRLRHAPNFCHLGGLALPRGPGTQPTRALAPHCTCSHTTLAAAPPPRWALQPPLPQGGTAPLLSARLLCATALVPAQGAACAWGLGPCPGGPPRPRWL